jgi:hypothetical protein
MGHRRAVPSPGRGLGTTPDATGNLASSHGRSSRSSSATADPTTGGRIVILPAAPPGWFDPEALAELWRRCQLQYSGRWCDQGGHEIPAGSPIAWVRGPGQKRRVACRPCFLQLVARLVDGDQHPEAVARSVLWRSERWGGQPFTWPCRSCGRSVFGFPASLRRACCEQCRQRMIRARRRVPLTCQCDGCGSDFTPTRKDARFCSNACRQRAYRWRRNRRAPIRNSGPDRPDRFDAWESRVAGVPFGSEAELPDVGRAPIRNAGEPVTNGHSGISPRTGTRNAGTGAP